MIHFIESIWPGLKFDQHLQNSVSHTLSGYLFYLQTLFESGYAMIHISICIRPGQKIYNQ
jgi:hypothetical protein